MRKILTAGVAVTLLLLVFGGMTARADDPVPGWNGTINIHEGATEPAPIERDEPKVCTFHLHGLGFDAGEHVDWWIIKGAPFDSLPILEDGVDVDQDGAYVSQEYTLDPDQYKLFWAGQQAGGAKHKVFKVECAEESVAPSTEPSTTPSTAPSSSTSPSATPVASVSLPTPTPNVDSGGGPDLTPPPTDAVEDAASFALTAVGLYLLVAIGLVFIGLGVAIYLWRRLSE
jgi:hypothetical protein